MLTAGGNKMLPHTRSWLLATIIVFFSIYFSFVDYQANTISTRWACWDYIFLHEKGKATCTISLYLEDTYQQKLSLALRLESKTRIWSSVSVLYKCSYTCRSADITTHIYCKIWDTDSEYQDIHHYITHRKVSPYVFL